MRTSAKKLTVLTAAFCLLSTAAIAQDAAPAGRAKSAASMPTPRTPDGHPDLTGLWMGGGGGGAFGEVTPTNDDYLKTDANGFAPSIIATRNGSFTNFERDSTLTKRMGGNLPKYKPQYWDTVNKLDRDNNHTDPSNNCMPAGVPRVGAPSQIVQTPNALFLMYVPGGASGATATFREIPTDGRQHTALEDLDGSWNGESIGHWDGDTLVIDSIGFNANSWLDKQGYLHSENMHVVERLTRNGNTLTWQATVDDPDVLLAPWVMNPVTVRLNPNPKAILPEPDACSERDLAHTVTKEHH